MIQKNKQESEKTTTIMRDIALLIANESDCTVNG